MVRGELVFLVSVFALLFLENSIFSQPENYFFSDTYDVTIVISKISNEGPIKIVTGLQYSYLRRDSFPFEAYVLPDSDLKLPSTFSIFWQRMPFVSKNKYKCRVRYLNHKIYTLVDVRKVCFDKYDVCIVAADNTFGSLCEIMDIEKIR
jgi:hypothetical protein